MRCVGVTAVAPAQRDAFCVLQATARNGTVTFTATDSSPEFEELLENWVCHLRRVGIPPVVWALDASTQHKLHRRSDVWSIYMETLQLSMTARPSQYKRPASDECART